MFRRIKAYFAKKRDLRRWRLYGRTSEEMNSLVTRKVRDKMEKLGLIESTLCVRKSGQIIRLWRPVGARRWPTT